MNITADKAQQLHTVYTLSCMTYLYHNVIEKKKKDKIAW